MEVNILQVLTEYIAMLSCLYCLSKHRPIWTLYNVIGLIINFLCVLLCMNYYGMKTKICGYIFVLVLAKYFFGFCWKETIKYFGLMLIVVSVLQLWIYVVFGTIILGTLGTSTVGIIENSIIIFIFIVWKRNCAEIVFRTISRFKESVFIIVFCLFFAYILYMRNKMKMLSSQVIIQTCLCMIGIILVTILWLVTEREKKRKTEELRAYELYTKSYEETVAAIRMKQHEFKNHINAILCMQYTIEDKEELRNAQMKYCQEILNDNSLNDLLKVRMSPVIIGYLYSKFTFALERGIYVEYDIQDIAPDESIAVHDLVEIIGILFDNAVEALAASEETQKQIYVRIGLDEQDKFYIEVANVSRTYGINEMSAFFQYGNSTKGEGRGIGLHQAKKLSEKYKGIISADNIKYEGRNYISFKVLFK